MEGVIVDRVSQLEKQVVFYRSLVTQHNQLLREVHSLLDASGSSRVATLQKQIRSLQAQQESALGGADMMSTSAGGSPLKEEQVEAAASEAASKIQVATVKLLNLWHEHTAAKIDRLLKAPFVAFDEFNENPTNEGLSEFLDSFKDSVSSINELMNDRRSDTGPAGNPFEIDDRLVKLFKTTIRDSFLATPVEPQDPRWQTQEAKQKLAPPKPATFSELPPRSDPVNSRREHTVRSLVPPIEPLRAERLNSGASTPVSERAATPSSRRSARGQDSSQMRAMLGGDTVDRPTSSVPFEQLPRLAQLKLTLQQLELQLNAVATAGRDSGSEAKYYALAKKLQRVRAEVVKEQREQEEIEKAKMEVQMQRAERQTHREAFRR